jgi:antitoxin component YwqK of YwqJK toxin-antitoxin module
MAQSISVNDTLFFDKDWKECSRKEHKFYRTYSTSDLYFEDKKLTQISDFFKNGNYQMTGYVLDGDTINKYGQYTYYDKSHGKKTVSLFKPNIYLNQFPKLQEYTSLIATCDSSIDELYISFLKDGTLYDIGYFDENSKRTCQWYKIKKGKVYKYYFHNGKYNGRAVRYNKHGNIKHEVDYVNDKKHGDSIYYYKDGSLNYVAKYRHGEHVSSIHYDKKSHIARGYTTE